MSNIAAAIEATLRTLSDTEASLSDEQQVAITDLAQSITLLEAENAALKTQIAAMQPDNHAEQLLCLYCGAKAEDCACNGQVGED